MKVVQINGGVYGSTGKIMFDIANELKSNGNKCLCFSPVTQKKQLKDACLEYVKIGSYLGRKFNAFLDHFFCTQGGFCFFSTWTLIKKIKKFDPDVIHLHTLHGSYINVKMLFKYLKNSNKKIVWTFHDCWPITGHCCHFSFENCQKWKNGCFDCPKYNSYPSICFDNSRKSYNLKKRLFSSIDNLTIITPSEWLANIVKDSFLGNKRIRVINNGIDLDVFKPTSSDFKRKFKIEDKKIVLGVSFVWGFKKGLDVFEKLSEDLGDDYKIVLVGTTEDIERTLSKKILCIRRTNNARELAKIYSAVDMFVNPTREENYPTVNMEAIACGCPVICFDTGGCKEIINNINGTIINQNDYNMLIASIYNNCSNIDRYAITKSAMKYNKNNKVLEYIREYCSDE